MKRVIDIIASVLLLALLSPVLCLVGLAIYLSDFSSIFFKQRRIGRAGTEFWMYKFRSMVVNAESLGGYSTQPNDARITKIGRFIRSTSLDELPQLFNVLKGDMSLVGPRPNVPMQKNGYTEAQWRLRHSIRPGITGLSQATLRSKATAEQRNAMDLEYVQNISLIGDIKIILMTIQQIFIKNNGN